MIMPDQMRGDTLSLENHPVLETPNIDSIGSEGTHFKKAYTTCASCIPARRSLLTGLHPSSNGMVGYKNGYPIEDKTLPQALTEGGYHTAMIGRYMHQYPPEASYGFQKRILGSTHVTGDDYASMLKKKIPGFTNIKEFFNGLGVSYNGWEANSWPYEDELHPTNWVVQQSRKYLRQHDPDQPLFMVTSFYAPHPPLIPPPKYFEKYLHEKLPFPAIGDWCGPAPEDSSKLNAAHRVNLCGEALRRAQAGYFGLIKHLDDQLQPLIGEFKKKSEESGRPWMIIFISDHGEMLGDHYYFRKCEPYEGASKIPFLIQGAKEFGLKHAMTNNTPVCLEDIMPTVLDAAGGHRPNNLDGRSLMPVLRGEAAQVRDVLHGEHAPVYGQDQAYHFLTDGKMKYVWRPVDGQEQLFDLENDKYEEHDLSNDRPWGETLNKWRKKLAQQLKDRPEAFSDGEHLQAGRPYEATLPFLNNKE